MQSLDHPELRFISAAGYTRGRPDGRPLWIIAHTMEAGESSTRAENTAAYFANPGDGRQVSAHYCADNDSIVQCVLLQDTAWTVGNRPGNNRGINWEFSGFAGQTAAQWGDAFSMAMLRRAAPYWYADAERYHIPIRRCSVDDLRAFKPGLTTHNDLRLAFNVTTHTDPGPNFPWSAFISMINESGEDGGDDDVGSEIVFEIQSEDPTWHGRAYISNRFVRREVRRPNAIRGAATTGLPRVVLTDAMLASLPDRSNDDWESFIRSVAGPDHQSVGGGSGTIQTVALNGTISGTISGEAGVVTDPP